MKNKPLSYESRNRVVPTQRLAVIEIGTNTFRLLIGRVKKNGIENVYSERIITRLGEGISGRGLITKNAAERSIAALKRFRNIISQHQIHKTSAVATSALREAKNRREFLKKAKEAAGFDIKIISGREEAKMTALGMMIGISPPENTLMVDIGGGSTEIIFVRRKKPVLMRSLNLGVVYLAERYMKNDPPLKRDLDKMGRHICREIETIVKPFSKLITYPERVGTRLPGLVPKLRGGAGKTALIGTAGTITALSAISQRLTKFEHSRIHNSTLTFEKIRNIFSKISTITARERIKYHPFEPSRLDIIVPGTLILLKLMEAFGFKEIKVSNYGLREGILLELYEKNN